MFPRRSKIGFHCTELLFQKDRHGYLTGVTAIDDNVKLSSFISVFKKRWKDQYVERY